MSFFHQPKSLKMRLCLYFTLITIVPSLLTTIFYYFYSTNLLKQTMIQNANANESYIINNIDNKLQFAVDLSDWIFLNNHFKKTLGNRNLKGFELYKELIDNQQILSDEVLSSSIARYVSSIIISGSKNIEFRFGDNTSLIDKSKIMSTTWFKESMKKRGAVYFSGIIKNPNRYDFDAHIIPIVRPIFDTTLEKYAGWSFTGIRENIISDEFINLFKQNGNSIYMIDNAGRCISSSDNQYIGRSMVDEEFIYPILHRNKSGYYDAVYKGKECLIVQMKSRITGWNLVQRVSYEPLYKQRAVLFRMTLIISIVALLVMLSFTVFLSTNLTRPLKRILKRMRKISQGNFERDESLEGNDEMGELGRGINELSQNINKLLSKVKEEEAEKRNLELMVLQNQVNPHFLYNTLNSIKWMATVQKAEGIRNIVSALGRLLMNISREKSDVITIRQELSLTEDYILIQNIRYNGKIKHTCSIADDRLLNYNIVKFTFQPIVENAIFHGIEPKKEAGNIKISITEEDDNVIIFIEDDGVGMDSDSIKNIFNRGEKCEKRGLSGIGIKNVDERLKLFYGEGYGLCIESEIGEFTRVIVKIPKKVN